MGTGPVKVSAHTTHNIQGEFNMQFTRGGAYAVCGGRCLSGSAPSVSRVGAGSSLVAVSGRVRPPIDPFEYRWRHALLQVCGATMWFLFGERGFPDEKIDETSTRSAGTGGGAS